MTAADETSNRYRAQLRDGDPVVRRVAEEQLARLERRPSPASADGDYPPSRWRRVNLTALLEEAGNRITERPNGTFVSGHEPAHSSRSGSCLVYWPDSGRWQCSSCRQGGDGIDLLRSLTGWSYFAAASYLSERFGVPPICRARRAPGRTETFRYG
jgi:hypothetical protein